MASRRTGEGRKKRGERATKKGRSVVKKDFPAIYLHLRAVNNSRVSARECVSRHTLSKKLCHCDVRLGLLFHRPLVSSTSNISRVRWTRAFVERHLKRCITFYVNPLKGALEIITIISRGLYCASNQTGHQSNDIDAEEHPKMPFPVGRS